MGKAELFFTRCHYQINLLYRYLVTCYRETRVFGYHKIISTFHLPSAFREII